MIKKMAWNLFKNTGNIESFMEFKEIEKLRLGDVHQKSKLDSETELGFGYSHEVSNELDSVKLGDVHESSNYEAEIKRFWENH